MARLKKLTTLEQVRAIVDIHADTFDEDGAPVAIYLRMNRNILVLEEKKEVVGFIVYKDWPDEFNISCVAVAEDAQNCGYGTQMMQYVEALARKAKKKGMSLIVDPNGNKEAHRLYRRLGYARSLFHSHDGKDQLFMRKVF